MQILNERQQSEEQTMNTKNYPHRTRPEIIEEEVRPQSDRPGLENRVVDPVCFMRVLTKSPFYAVHEGRKYHFCSERCLHEFRKDPKL